MPTNNSSGKKQRSSYWIKSLRRFRIAPVAASFGPEPTQSADIVAKKWRIRPILSGVFTTLT